MILELKNDKIMSCVAKLFQDYYFKVIVLISYENPMMYHFSEGNLAKNGFDNWRQMFC